jgi:transcriptional regulator GlxA family with amidase domain
MKRIAIVALNGCYASSVSQLLDMVQMADTLAGDERERIVCEVVSLTGASAHLTDCIAIPPVSSLDAAKAQYDLVFVPAADYVDSKQFFERLASFKPLYPWLERQWQGGAIVASLCTGTFVLAKAGLLDRRLATTSWWLEKLFHRAFPAVKLDISRDITESDRIVCGSTLATGPQLALKLIEMLTSAAVATTLARLVMFDVRSDPGSDSEPGAAQDDLVALAQNWFLKNIASKIRLAEAAATIGVSERTLIRHFKKKLGITPHQYLQGIRIDSAKQLLGETNLHIGKVAERVGYSDVAFFQQVFRNHVGVSPTVFRKTAPGRQPQTPLR